MPGHIKMTPMMGLVGDDANSAANRIRAAGENMYSNLRGLVQSGHLTGPGIQVALEESHSRWNLACDDFAQAEQRFGAQCHNTEAAIMAADARGAGYF